MTASPHRVAPYLDGALSAADEEHFLDHLATCRSCEAELADEMQLRAREPAPGVTVLPFRRRPLVIAAIGLVSFAAILVVWLTTRPRTEPAVVRPALALAATRSQEARLAYPGAAAFRPYSVDRGAAVHEDIAPAAIAALERAGDCHGVAVAYLLGGEYERAERTFARCPDGPDLDADRAALALARGDGAAALALADRALAARPDHPAARWNRGLALRGLGLGLAAAEVFEQITDPAWTEEARTRVAALRRDLFAMRDSWTAIAAAGSAMVAGGPVLSLEAARRHPAIARVHFHDAVRTAKTVARLEELRPLARALEGIAGDHLERYLDPAQLTPARLALVDEYAAMVAAQDAATPAFHAWLARARAAHADDLVLGALVVTGRIGEAPAEAARIAAATGDPWFELGVVVWRVVTARFDGKIAEALALLDAGEAQCTKAKLAYRCLQLAYERAAIEAERDRSANAQRVALEAMHAAESLGEWTKRLNAALLAGDAARGLKRFAIARALYREHALGDGSCEAGRQAAALDAEMLFDEHRIEQASVLARALPACGHHPAIAGTPDDTLAVGDPGRRASQIDQIALILEVDLAAAGAITRDRPAIARDLETARAAASGSSALMFDYLAARLDLAGGGDAVERLRGIARQARSPTRTDALAHAVATAAATAAVAGAGAREQWQAALAIVAEANGLAAPSRCALAVAADDYRFVGVAVDRDGKLAGVNASDVRPSTDWLAPLALRRHLRGCETVDVLAMPSWSGVGALLDPEVPWRYVLGPHRAPTPGPARRVIIAEPVPPAALGLPTLAPWTAAVPANTTLVTGRAATPERVSSELRDATTIEIHAHTDRVALSDARVLALTEGAEGWALTAEAISKLSLARAPVVVLADCAGAELAPYRHALWGLPTAFWNAGARAVVAPITAIPDADAVTVFAKLQAMLAEGTPVAVAVAKLRSEALAADPASWVRYLVVFE